MSRKKRKKKTVKRTRGKRGARRKFGFEKPVGSRSAGGSYENPYGEQPARRHTSGELLEILNNDPSEDIE